MKTPTTLAALFIAAIGFTQTTPGSQQTIKLKYDTNVLRISGNKVPIGIVSYSDKGVLQQTRGLLNGNYNWTKYRIEVDSGSYTNGKIKMGGSTTLYKKGDSVTVHVYARKWLLGGKGALLLTGKIPYNYETGIKILTKGTFTKAPGNHVGFGIHTTYNNKMTVDKWAPASKNLQDFVLAADSGSHISKSKGDLKIDNDPVKIINDKVRLIAILAKDPAIKDTLQIVLDYVANYQCNIASANTGHNLKVTANVYDDSLIHAKLMHIHVSDSIGKKAYDYVFNTVGGSIHISTKGANGADGTQGYTGANGSNGSDGIISTTDETTTNADGTTSTTTITSQGPGSDGSNGDDGGNGTDGDNGSNGGNITVIYNAAAQPYLNLLTAVSIPGTGGMGGMAGSGGAGGSGGSGNPSGMSGNRGNDGLPGNDGANGISGKVIFMPQ